MNNSGKLPSNTINSGFIAKCIVIGDSTVGKSSLLTRFFSDDFTYQTSRTIGIEFKDKTGVIDGKFVKIHVWDTAGQEKYLAITKNFYNKAKGIFLVYDVTNKESFEHTLSWIEQIKENARTDVVVQLVANKVDLDDKKVISTEEGEKLAQKLGMKFFEVSALSGKNVNEAFYELWKDVIKNQFPHVEQDFTIEQPDSSSPEMLRRKTTKLKMNDDDDEGYEYGSRISRRMNCCSGGSA